eukprot:SAG22_NODE_18_length_32591_cov_38.043549_3_plen_314_part_00
MGRAPPKAKAPPKTKELLKARGDYRRLTGKQVHWSKDLPAVLKAIHDEQELRAEQEQIDLTENTRPDKFRSPGKFRNSPAGKRQSKVHRREPVSEEEAANLELKRKIAQFRIPGNIKSEEEADKFEFLLFDNQSYAEELKDRASQHEKTEREVKELKAVEKDKNRSNRKAVKVTERENRRFPKLIPLIKTIDKNWTISAKDKLREMHHVFAHYTAQMEHDEVSEALAQKQLVRNEEIRWQTEIETMMKDNLREVEEHVTRKEMALTTQSDESSEESEDEGFQQCQSLPLEDVSPGPTTSQQLAGELMLMNRSG